MAFAKTETSKAAISQQINDGKADFFYKKARQAAKNKDFEGVYDNFIEALEYRNDIKTEDFRKHFLFWAEQWCSPKEKNEVKLEPKQEEKPKEQQEEQSEKQEIHKKVNQKITPSEKSYSVEEKRKTNEHAYKRWTIKEESQLKDLFHLGHTVQEITKIMGRDKGAIISRLHKIELKK
jgi:hypothetical protein